MLDQHAASPFASHAEADPVEADRVRTLVRRLNRTDRTVVMLFYADGLTPTEIAAVLDVAPQRVAQTLTMFRHMAARTMHLAAAA